ARERAVAALAKVDQHDALLVEVELRRLVGPCRGQELGPPVAGRDPGELQLRVLLAPFAVPGDLPLQRVAAGSRVPCAAVGAYCRCSALRLAAGVHEPSTIRSAEISRTPAVWSRSSAWSLSSAAENLPRASSGSAAIRFQIPPSTSCWLASRRILASKLSSMRRALASSGSCVSSSGLIAKRLNCSRSEEHT